jgi:putative addiction module antidote
MGDNNKRYNEGAGGAMTTLKLIAVGNSVGVVLPRELLAKLRVSKGDSLYVTETQRGVELSPYRPDFARQVDVAEDIMRENRNVLKKLAE